MDSAATVLKPEVTADPPEPSAMPSQRLETGIAVTPKPPEAKVKKKRQRRFKNVPVAERYSKIQGSTQSPTEQKPRMGFTEALMQLSRDWPETALTRMEGDMLAAWFSMKNGRKQEAIDRLRATANRLETRRTDEGDPMPSPEEGPSEEDLTPS